MNAVEKLQAAIDKLEALKAESTPGPWSAPKEILGLRTSTIFGHSSESLPHAAYVASAHDGDLIVTLHRTIDAQLAILREAIRQGNDQLLFVFPFNAYDRSAVALADAILGEE